MYKCRKCSRPAEDVKCRIEKTEAGFGGRGVMALSCVHVCEGCNMEEEHCTCMKVQGMGKARHS